MAESKEFCKGRSEMLKNWVVVGNRNENPDVLIAKPNLDLPRAIEMCNLHDEGVEKAAKAIEKRMHLAIKALREQIDEI